MLASAMTVRLKGSLHDATAGSRTEQRIGLSAGQHGQRIPPRHCGCDDRAGRASGTAPSARQWIDCFTGPIHRLVAPFAFATAGCDSREMVERNRLGDRNQVSAVGPERATGDRADRRTIRMESAQARAGAVTEPPTPKALPTSTAHSDVARNVPGAS